MDDVASRGCPVGAELRISHAAQAGASKLEIPQWAQRKTHKEMKVGDQTAEALGRDVRCRPLFCAY